MIVIYGIRDKLDPIKSRLSDVVHGCMQSILGMPEDKRAHRFMPMDRDDFYCALVVAAIRIPLSK
ncbi:MAG: hypothetical protein V7707_19425 [Motiliproteus sp.]